LTVNSIKIDIRIFGGREGRERGRGWAVGDTLIPEMHAQLI